MLRHLTGMVFNIQRFSIHDGPGIRTTVFLKGCSLRCFWCHNPEGLRAERELAVHPRLCILCGACVAACPRHAHSILGADKRFAREVCDSLGVCAEHCYTGALEMMGRRMSVAQVMEEVRADVAFYRNSGGGVTLSGGEPLVQHRFSRAILQACAGEGIQTGLETSGNAPWETVAALLPLLDLVMMDLKLMDPERHRRATGSGNELILANARRLALTDRPIVFRVPVVPTVNDTEEEIAAIASFVRSLVDLRLRRRGAGKPEIDLELLAFHPLAADKYRGLGRENPVADLRPLSDERMESLRNIAKTIFSRS